MPPGFDEEAIEEAFTYHKPTEGQKKSLIALREKHKELARLILALTPGGPLQTLAIRKLEECSMWSNKAIVLEPPEAADLRPLPESG